MKPRMVYFGPWDRAGHHLVLEDGSGLIASHAGTEEEQKLGAALPWNPMGYGNKPAIDCRLQPGCHQVDGHWRHGKEVEGSALLHHLNGWTALSFWDRSVDMRGGCNSTYFAEGTFTFEEMVAMAKERFAERWSRMKFEVRLAEET